MNRRRRERGFTLMEVVIALAILGMSLGVLLTAQSSSLNNAARSRDITIGSLLARSKLIDIEKMLADEGFVEGEQEEEGDFDEEGYPKIKWRATIREIELDIGGLSSMCAFLSAGEEEQSADCEAMLGSFGGMMEGFTTSVANSVRVIEVVVTWPVAERFEESMTIRGLVTRQDLTLSQGGTFSTGGGPGPSQSPPQNAPNSNIVDKLRGGR